jgi:hypothetical protein
MVSGAVRVISPGRWHARLIRDFRSAQQGCWYCFQADSVNSYTLLVNHLTSQLAVKLAPSFVTVNAILPGYVNVFWMNFADAYEHLEFIPAKCPLLV